MKKNKKRTIVLWIVFALFAAASIVITVFYNNIFGKGHITSGGAFVWDKEPILNDVVSDNAVIQFMYSNFTKNMIRSVQIIGFALILAVLLHYLAKITFRTKRGLTISKLIVNFLKWAIGLVTLFFVLDAWGADTTAMLVSAGVVTLIIGLGSQSLVADILAGIFIVFEGEFQVGDIVIIDGWRGEVLQIGIRTTRLIDAGGNIKVVNNSEIKTIINQTQELSIAKCYVGISYGDRIEKVEKIIADNLPKIKEKIPAIVEGPFYKGVSELAESSVNLLFVAKCKENGIYQVQRDLNREIKIVFDDNNVNIPFPQVTLSYEEGSKLDKVSAREKNKAEEFIEEQKEVSKGIEVKK